MATTATGAWDVSWGLLAIVRLASEETREWRTWIEIVPRDASEYLKVESIAAPDGKTIRFNLALRDDDRDGQPDLAPIDFSSETPLRILADIGSGIELKRALLPPLNRSLAPDQLQDTFSVVSQDRINDEVELRLDVDGAPRAVCHYVGLGGRAGRREPPNRMWIESIALDAKDGLRYTRGFKLNRQANERELGRLGAAFQRPVTSPIQIVLAADTRSSFDQSAGANALQLKLARPGWEVNFGQRTGDRDLTVTIPAKPATSIPIRTTLSDWTFSLDASTLGDMEAYFQGSVAGSGERRLTGGRLILDGTPPRQFGRESIQDVDEGQNSRLVFAVSELSGISSATIMLGLAGQPGSSQPIVESLPADQFIPISGGWQVNPVILPVKQRPAGEYEITVQIEDLVGNAGKLGPWKLIIKKPKASATGTGGQFKGPVVGKLYFGTTTSKPPNPVTVTIKDFPGRPAISEDGTFRIPDVEAGSYEIQATSEHRGLKYEGSAKIELKEPEDWKQLVEISLMRQ